MVCSYCQKDERLTGEHLIPMSLINMFPECDFNFRHDKETTTIFKSEKIVINDVCHKCNNEDLSKLDAYGSSVVQEYFIKTYKADDELVLPYNYSLLSRWLLKILFNIARTKKSEIDNTSFESNRDYILGKTEKSAMPFSVFGGLSVDMTPLPEFFFNNLKLGVFFNPYLIESSLLEVVNPMENKFQLSKDAKNLKLDKLMLSGLLRFGSGIFLVFLWEEDITPVEQHIREKLIQSLYPYVLISRDLDNATLKRVTHAYNYNNYYLIDTSMGLSIADQTNSFLPVNRNPTEIRMESSVEWDLHVTQIRENRASKRQRERDKRLKKKKSK